MAVGAAKASATLKYDAELYTPYALESWPDSEMRKEYTRLRDIAQKRIKRLSKDPISSTSDIYKEFAGGVPTIRQCAEIARRWNKPLQMLRVLSAPRGPLSAGPVRNSRQK